MRRILVATAGLLLAAGCGNPAEKPLAVPVPAPSSTLSPSPLAAKPDPQNGYLAHIKYQLQEQTVAMANLSRPTSARCTPDRLAMAKGEQTTCVVGYDGLKLEWSVQVTNADQTGLDLDAKPSGGILTRRGVFAAFHQQFRPEGHDLRCDKMPKRELVSLREKSDYRCQYQEEKGKRVAFHVVPTESGPTFKEV